MSDAQDAVREAKAENRRRAAMLAARKEAAAAEVAALLRQKAEVGEILAASQTPEHQAQAQELLQTVTDRLEAKRVELGAATQDLNDTLAELRQLDRLGLDAARNDAQAAALGALGGDPLIRTPEQVALDNARGHIADVDAQARLDEELAPEPAPAAPVKKTFGADDARAEFAALRAKRDPKPTDKP